MYYSVKTLKRQLLAASLRKLGAEEEDLIIWSSFRKLVIGLVGEVDTGLRDQMLSLITSRDVVSLLRLTEVAADPLKHGSAASYWRYAVLAAYLKKFPFQGVPSLSPLDAAKQRSAKAETLCRLTNKRLTHYRGKEYRLSPNRRYVGEVLHLARLKISNWLGSASAGYIADKARHGPGGCIGVRRPGTTKYYKYSAAVYTVTARCFPYANALFSTDALWRRSLSGLGPFDFGPPLPVEVILRERCTVADYNKITYVPKTALTHRAIAVEPMLNVYFQLGVGKAIRDKLRVVGLDLNEAWVRNKQLARLGSLGLTGGGSNLSTIDLSMASDTLAVELVRELLPPDWFDLLWALRSPNGKLGDQLQPWAKFSSMGNGYTFELETLIFYALAKSVCKSLNVPASEVSVFGDDIVIPTVAYDRFTDILRYVGFKLNMDKTFTSGPFRESCGGDYFDGEDVRPFFLKRRLTSVRDLIFLRNNLDQLLKRGVELGVDPSLREEMRQFLDARIPKVIRDHLLGPSTGPADGVLYTSWEGAHRSSLVVWDRDLHEMRYPVLNDRAREYPGDPAFVYLQFMEGTRQGDEYFVYKWSGETLASSGSRSIVTRSRSTVTQLHSEIALNWV